MVGITDSNVKTVVSGSIISLDSMQLRSYPRSGSSWNSLTTASLSATLLNGAAFNTVSSSILFDGVDDLATISFPFALQDCTFEFWMRSTNRSQGYQMLMGVENATATNVNNIVFDVNDPDLPFAGATFNNKTIWVFLNSSGNPYSAISSSLPSSSLVDETWRHYAFTRKTTTNHYINGDLVTVGVNRDGSQTDIIGSFSTPYTASIAYWGSLYFAGYMNAVRIYDRELSAAEVKQNYLADKIRFGL